MHSRCHEPIYRRIICAIFELLIQSVSACRTLVCVRVPVTDRIDYIDYIGCVIKSHNRSSSECNSILKWVGGGATGLERPVYVGKSDEWRIRSDVI